MQYYAIVRTDDYISHHGVKGQKWGRRRYQNPDGTLINPKGIIGQGRNKYKSYGFTDHKGNIHLTNKNESAIVKKNTKAIRRKSWAAAGIALGAMAANTMLTRSGSYKRLGIAAAQSAAAIAGMYALHRSSRKNAMRINSVRSSVLKRHGVKGPKVYK